MLIVGLLLLAAAVLVGVAGVAANTGSEHQLAGGFAIFGYHVHGSAGKLFLAGLLIGAVGMLGFLMATEGLRRNAALRRELFRFRRQERVRARGQAPAPATNERVLARTAPSRSSDTTDTGTSAGKGSGKDAGGGSGSGGGTDGAADTSGGGSGWRRTLSNWRTTRPTS